MSRAAKVKTVEDVGVIGYPAVRDVFNEVLNILVAKLTTADWEMANELLGESSLDEEDLEFPDPDLMDDEMELLGSESADEGERFHMLADTALYSRPGDAWSRKGRKRAIDRLAPKMPFKRDPLKATIVKRLPQAYFSLFESKGRQPDGTLQVVDLLDERALSVMDDGLAASAKPGTLFAARLVDLGPWHLGFGIVVRLRKSEAVALLLSLSHPGSLAEKRDALHEIVYLCHLHEEDIVMAALAPLISVLSFAIDQDDASPVEIAGPMRSALGSVFVA